MSLNSGDQSQQFIGRVKWFNSKSGYGFISITDGLKSGTDVFVHHSSISTGCEQYKYLVQGEYVEFVLGSLENSNHEFQACNVKGIKGGKLMCETRKEQRVSRIEHNNSNSLNPQSVRPPRINKKSYQKK